MNNNKIKGLRQDLTFEEFEALANRKPNLQGDWLYRVTQAILPNDLKYPYPKFELSHVHEAYFKTFYEAENFVKKNTTDVYCSWITQMLYGAVPGYGGDGAEWLYDNKGQLLDYTVTYGFVGNVEDYTFFGRPKTRQRFKEGDIVEVVTARSVHLAVLNLQIPDVEWCWQRYIKRDDEIGFFYHLDFSDDSAVVLDGPNYYCHDHIGALQLLKPRFPIPEDILEEMSTWNDRSKNETDSDWLKDRESYRTEREMEKGTDVGDFYSLNLYIDFDEGTQLPHLHINDLYGLKVALRIDRPKYYDHGDYTGRLTDNQVKDLQSYLTLQHYGKSRWWHILRKWNIDNDNPKQRLPLDTPLPDYSKLLSCTK